MKKITLTLLLLTTLVSFKMKSQLAISCYYRETCYWNNYTKEFDDCSGYDERGLFEINANQTMVVHTINNITSTYYVKSREYEEESETLSLNVISDVGNKYIIIFDAKHLLVKFLRNDGALVMFYVKSAF